MTIKTRTFRAINLTQLAVIDAYYTAKFNRQDKKAAKKEAEYEAMIAESQAKLAETTLVPGYTKIYC
jgi:hypothetical protein